MLGANNDAFSSVSSTAYIARLALAGSATNWNNVLAGSNDDAGVKAALPILMPTRLISTRVAVDHSRSMEDSRLFGVSSAFVRCFRALCQPPSAAQRTRQEHRTLHRQSEQSLNKYKKLIARTRMLRTPSTTSLSVSGMEPAAVDVSSIRLTQ